MNAITPHTALIADLGAAPVSERTSRLRVVPAEHAALVKEIAHHRRQVAFFMQLKGFFRTYPAVPFIPHEERGTIKRYEADQGYTINRIAHSKKCRKAAAMLPDQRAPE